MRLSEAELSRFVSKVVRVDNCLLWAGTLDYHGYGVFWLNGKMVKAHKIAYNHVFGEVKAGNIIHHVCATRHCVNPEHLTEVEIQNHHLTFNVRKGSDHHNGGKVHCVNNHLYTIETTRIETDKYGQTRRRCRLCDKIKNGKRGKDIG